MAHNFHLRHPQWSAKVTSPADKCAFDYELERMGLVGESEEQLASASDAQHQALRMWAKRNAHRRYVPSDLLQVWGIQVPDEDLILGR